MPEFDLDHALDRAAADPDSRRAALLRSAETLFAQRGYDGVRVREIADAGGANVATLHLHWKSKAMLYEAVCRQHARELLAFIERAEREARTRGLPLREQIPGWVDAALELLAQRPAIAPLALQSVTGQAPPDMPSLFLHDVSLFRGIEAQLRKAMPADAHGAEPILAVLCVFYFSIVAFCDSPLQRALLGGSVYDDSEVRVRIVRFTRAMLELVLGPRGGAA